MSGQNTSIARQALLLFIQEFRKERKTLGFGSQMDHSVHLALQYRTFNLLKQFRQADIVIVHGGSVPRLEGAHYLPERGADFNARFVNALQDTFALGYERIVAVGGDIPTLNQQDIGTALDRNGLVLGPTHDGGFYLAALAKEDVSLFNQLPWRQTHLFARLLERVRDRCLDCRILDRRRDIDQVADARHTASLLIELVRTWLKNLRLRCCFPTARPIFLNDRIPEPRYSSLPPPRIALLIP